MLENGRPDIIGCLFASKREMLKRENADTNKKAPLDGASKFLMDWVPKFPTKMQPCCLSIFVAPPKKAHLALDRVIHPPKSS